jgi:hypothetical protein
MPREVCSKCKVLKFDVTLCADDRLCRECYEENERQLVMIHKGKMSDIASSQGSQRPAETSSSAVLVSAVTDTAKSDDSRKTSKSKSNSKVTKSRTGVERPEATSGSAVATGADTATNVAPKALTKPVGQSLGDVEATKIVCNELLSYVGFHRDQATHDQLHQAVVRFYHPDEIAAAKRSLITEYAEYLSECILTTSRRQSSSCSVEDAEIDDILGIFDILDNRNLLKSVLFAAINLDRLPKYWPKDMDVCDIIDKQSLLEVKVDALVERTSAADARVASNVDDKLNELRNSTQVQLDSIAAICSRMVDKLSAISTRNEPAVAAVSEDRTRNVVIAGLPEDRDPTVWRDSIRRVLRLAAGRDIHIDDAFRLGKFIQGRTRLILVKVNSIWDRRLILSGSCNLKGDAEFRRRVYITADEAPEVRRRATYDRLKAKALCDGKDVLEFQGVLKIDGIEVFCENRGFLRRQSLNISHTNGQ